MSQELSMFSEEEQAIIHQMGLTNVPVAHIKVFLHTAQSMHLDPRLKRDITLITRNTKNGPAYTIQVGIAGYRKAGRMIAKKEGETIQVNEWLFKGSDSDWTDVWDARNKNYPLAAKATVYRDGMPFTQVIMWDEFVQTYKDQPQALWATKPTYMLGKTAESLAWRQAFPEEMGNTYEESEVAAMKDPTTHDVRGMDAVRQALAQRTEKQADPTPELEARPTQIQEIENTIGAINNPDDLGEYMTDVLSRLEGDEWEKVRNTGRQRYEQLTENN